MGLVLKWQSRLVVVNLEPKQANAVIVEFVQSLSHPCCYGVHDGLVCSTTVTAAHALMAYATDHTVGGHHWILQWANGGNCWFLDEVQQPLALLLIASDCTCLCQRAPASERFVPDPGWAAVAEDSWTSIESAYVDLERL